MIYLKLQKSEIAEKYSCSLCKKDLCFQKIVALKKCGHVFCKKCLESVCKIDQICSNCNESFFPSDIILLKETGSGFSDHNTVQTNKLNPYFKF